MPKKNTFIFELKSILSSSNYSFNDISEEIIPVFFLSLKLLLMLEMNLIFFINYPILLVLLFFVLFLVVILRQKSKYLVIII